MSASAFVMKIKNSTVMTINQEPNASRKM